MKKLKPLLGGALVLTGALGLIMPNLTAWPPYGAAAVSAAALQLFGILCGLAVLRGRVLGHWGALAFYALQLASYYSPHFQYQAHAGLSVAAVFHPGDAVLVVNLLALALLAASAFMLRTGARQ